MRLYRWLLRSAWTNGRRAGRVVAIDEFRQHIREGISTGVYDYRSSADALRDVLAYLDERIEEVRHERAA